MSDFLLRHYREHSNIRTRESAYGTVPICIPGKHYQIGDTNTGTYLPYGSIYMNNLILMKFIFWGNFAVLFDA